MLLQYNIITGYVRNNFFTLMKKLNQITKVEIMNTSFLGSVCKFLGFQSVIWTFFYYLDSLSGYLDNLAVYTDRLSGYPDSLSGYLDILSGYLDSMFGYLDNLADYQDRLSR